MQQLWDFLQFTISLRLSFFIGNKYTFLKFKIYYFVEFDDWQRQYMKK